ncbi:MAG: stage V sporulation protein D [Clostridiaceae bacterium]
MKFVWGILCLVFFILSLRLSYIMIVKRKEYSAKAIEQWTSEVKISAKRGKILDRNGAELAVSANVYRIDFDLNSIRNYIKNKEITIDDVANDIAAASGISKEDVLKKLQTKLPSGAAAGSATLVRRIEKDPADKVKNLKITGVIISPDTKRYYPNNNFLAQAIGVTNTDGEGLGGVELEYNKQLSGVAGMRIAELDRKSGELPYTVSQFTPPVDGKDVTLTVDEKMQYFAEKAAQQALNDNKAKAVSVIIMNPKNGEILAMANKPDFDPNNPYSGAENFEGNTSSDKLQKMWRNRSVSDSFEPGSIFKVITAEAALEEGIGVNDAYTCGGSTVVGGRTIKCWKAGGHGTQTFGDILKNSCNVGFIQLGQKLGKELLNKHIAEFGLGKQSGVDLPGEATGIIKPTDKISDVDLATISFGQTNTVNPVQFMAAFNAVANNGTWIQPHIMKQVSHKDSNGVEIIDETSKPQTKTVATAEKTKELRGYLEKVVSEGSAKKTFIEGYHIAGKTGTAQKVNSANGTYENGKYISTFVGMAPADDPKITVMISIDEPSAGQYFAGVIATPVAHMLFTDIFNYMESDFSKIGSESVVKDVVIPEVRGLKVEEAKKKLAELKLDFNIDGDGAYVTDISPKPGYSVKEGSKLNLYTGNDANYNRYIIMPDVTGYSQASATELLGSLGITPEYEGVGLIDSQSVEAGELIKKGTKVKMNLSNETGDGGF